MNKQEIKDLVRQKNQALSEARRVHTEFEERRKNDSSLVWAGSEDEKRYVRFMSDYSELASKEERERELAEKEEALRSASREGAGRIIDDNDDASTNKRTREDEVALRRLQGYFRFANPETREGADWDEMRALQADQDIIGGYIKAPPVFVDGIIKAVDDLLFFRQLATVERVTNSDSLGKASLDTDPSDADWTAEIGTVQQDSAMRFGQRELRPHLLTKLLLISDKLLRVSPNALGIVQQRLAYKLAVPQESAFMLGDGTQKPLGVFVASDDGVPTSRDVATGNTVTSPTFIGLKHAKYSLKSQYWPQANWIYHRDIVKLLALIQDADNQFIWQENVTAGEVPRLLGIPVRMSEYAPNTIAASAYVGILGAFKPGYMIVDGMQQRIQRLDELYATSNQVGFKISTETDGMPVLAEAFARVQLAAS